MTHSHAIDAAVSAVCELEQGRKGIYTDAYGMISVRRSGGQYRVCGANGAYVSTLGHVVDVDWSDGIEDVAA